MIGTVARPDKPTRRPAQGGLRRGTVPQRGQPPRDSTRTCVILIRSLGVVVRARTGSRPSLLTVNGTYGAHERQKAELGNGMVYITFSSARGEKTGVLCQLGTPNFTGIQGRRRYTLAVTNYRRKARISRTLHNSVYPLHLFSVSQVRYHYCGEPILAPVSQICTLTTSLFRL